MTIFSPEADSVVIREHFYYDTGLDSLVVIHNDEGKFIPVEEKGLGIFDYLFASTTGEYPADQQPKSEVAEIPMNIVIILASVAFSLVVCFVLLRLFNRFTNEIIAKSNPRSYVFSPGTHSQNHPYRHKLRKIRMASKKILSRNRSRSMASSRRAMEAVSPVFANEDVIPYSFQTLPNTSSVLKKLPSLHTKLNVKKYTRASSINNPVSATEFNPTFHLLLHAQGQVSDNPFCLSYNDQLHKSTESSISDGSSVDSVFSPFRHQNNSDDALDNSPVFENDPMIIKMYQSQPIQN
ncbi:hypothetical protein DASC09_030640 [Saccharomycopsis crataegensis]|uniref:Uncharacterized protein n=1 Tax=Saccharomycopsis crataegensis TaxID=43959 RepID=A0AAV5QLX8_9ASCO|nr:hypothetical protein DASC09_030640 [Saccharomycopsis crataegensis]